MAPPDDAVILAAAEGAAWELEQKLVKTLAIVLAMELAIDSDRDPDDDEAAAALGMEASDSTRLAGTTHETL